MRLNHYAQPATPPRLTAAHNHPDTILAQPHRSARPTPRHPLPRHRRPRLTTPLAQPRIFAPRQDHAHYSRPPLDRPRPLGLLHNHGLVPAENLGRSSSPLTKPRPL